MAKKCLGTWDMKLVFDQGGTESGIMQITSEDDQGNIRGNHLENENATGKPLRNGKCKEKIHFERERNGETVHHDGKLDNDDKMSGTFVIKASGEQAPAAGGQGGGEGGKDEAGETGTWTGSRDGGIDDVEDDDEDEDENGYEGQPNITPPH